VPTVQGASGLERAANPAVLLLEVSAPVNTLLNRVLTCLAASGTASLANLTIQAIIPLPVPTAMDPMTLSPVDIFRVANGMALRASPTLVIMRAPRSIAPLPVHTPQAAIGRAATAKLALQATDLVALAPRNTTPSRVPT